MPIKFNNILMKVAIENDKKVIFAIEKKIFNNTKLTITLTIILTDSSRKYLRKYFDFRKLLPNFLNVNELFIMKLIITPP